MDDVVIRCPECGKKVAFSPQGARQAACPHCAAALDLSAFVPAPPARAVPLPAPVEVIPEVPVAPVAASAPHSHPASPSAPHAHHHHHHHAARGGRNATAAVLVVSGVAVVVAVAVLVGSTQTSGQGLAAQRLSESVYERELRDAPVPLPGGGLAPPPAYGQPATAVAPARSSAPKAEEEKKKEKEKERDEARPPPARREQELKTYPYLPDVSAEEQNRIEDSVRTAVEVGGRDGRAAEAYLVSMGLKAAPRLVGEFKNLQERHGFEKQEGLMRAMVVDRVLRGIDGVQERVFGDLRAIHVNSDPKATLQTVRHWNWWWDSGEYHKRPRPPWDPAKEEKDDPAER